MVPASSRIQHLGSITLGVGIVTIFCSLLAVSKVRHAPVYPYKGVADGLSGNPSVAASNELDRVRIYVASCENCAADENNQTYMDITVLKQDYRNKTLYINGYRKVAPVPALPPPQQISESKPARTGVVDLSPPKFDQIPSSNTSSTPASMTNGTCSSQFRRDYVKRQCSSRTMPKLSAIENFMWEQKHNLAFCMIYKCSSTTIIHMLNAANGGMNKEQLENLQKRNPIANSVHTFPKTHRKGLTQKKVPLHSAKELEKLDKFFIVRHPFDRIISCYLDKVGKNHDRYFGKLRTVIWNNYSPLKNRTVFSPATRTSKRMLAREPFSNQQIQFPMFVQFIIDYNKNRQDRVKWRGVEGGHVAHFNEFSAHCHFCQVDYNYILRTETLSEDLKPILKKLKLSADFLGGLNFNRFQSRDSSITEGYVLPLFQSISKQQITQLHDIYANDFKIFGYTFDADTRMAGCQMLDSNGNSCC